MPDRMPEDMPDRMPDRMPEDMSDRMPEDLPVTKCINVMVGITRSKVIFHGFPPIEAFIRCTGTSWRIGGPDHPLWRKDRRTPAMAREVPWRKTLGSWRIPDVPSGELSIHGKSTIIPNSIMDNHHFE